jgi:hypothetical protein
MASHTSLVEQQQFKDLLFHSCQQRAQYIRALQRVRGTRNEGSSMLSEAIFSQTSPAFSDQELAMRRKAEVLQHTGSSTQGGKRATKTQQFAALASKKRYASGAVQYGILNEACISNTFSVPTPTSSSNVPGPVQLLSLDPLVPLTNFLGMKGRENATIIPVLPPFNELMLPGNGSTVLYDSHIRKTRDKNDSLFLSSFTFFRDFAKIQTHAVPLSNLSVTLSFLVTAAAAKTAKKLRLDVAGVRPVVYVFFEPQTERDVIPGGGGTATLLPQQLITVVPDVPGVYSAGFLFPASLVHFYFPGNAQQTLRLAVDVTFQLVALDAADNILSQDVETNLANVSVLFYRG